MQRAEAILTPVPLEHLVDGAIVCRTRGTVLFGSQEHALFERLDDERASDLTVLIYASHAGAGGPFKATWRATYSGYHRFEELSARELRRHRPSSADTAEEARHWVGYYAVGALCELDNPVPLTSLTGKEGKALSPAFIPRGPLLVTYT